MSFSSIFYGSGNKPYTASYEGSTYTTQEYCHLPEYKAALTMTTEFGGSISGHTQPLAAYDSQLFSGKAVGVWVYKLYLQGHLVGTYQFSDQVFCFPATFDRVEGYCLSVSTTPSIASDNTQAVPNPSSLLILAFAAFAAIKRRK